MSTNHEPNHCPRSADNFNHISFSFDNLRSEEMEPRKTIDQYLRLKTNQSIQEKTNLPAKRSLCYRKSMRGSEADPDTEYQMQLRNDEQSLRIESLIKQYELKLAKQEEFFSLREWKLKEEIDNLTHQNGSLSQEVRRLKVAGKQQAAHCSLCSDGQIIAHLNAVIKEVEDSHRNCLDEKKQMIRKIDDSKGKLQVMEEEGEKLYQQYKALNKQVRSFNGQIHQLEQENSRLKQANNTLREAATKREAEWQSQQASFEQSIGDLKKKVGLMERREEESIASSKASVLSSIQNSMNGSFIKQKPPQKQQRNSISKLPPPQYEDRANTENYLYLRKTGEYPRSRNKVMEQKGGNTMQSLKWKFF